MKQKIIFTMSLLMLFLSNHSFSQTEKQAESPTPEKMQWFEDAKLGIFIHYGIYAVKGIGESWSFKNGQVTVKEYFDQLNGFTAKNYNPDQWAALFKEAGAKYAVLTSKHHDGVALYDSKLSDLNVVKKTPAKRDLITPFAAALRKQDLKVGIYFSHLDWMHPDYATVFNEKGPKPTKPDTFNFPIFKKEDTLRWNNFIKFRNGQLAEIQKLTNPDLLWFDGDWNRSERQWKMKELRDQLLAVNPNVILNSRMVGYGDYATPEQGIPVVGPKGPWELCMTINDSWGYQPKDTNNKSIDYILKIFTECIGLGGNLLLDVGPMPDGTIAPYQTQILKQLGAWTKKHQEAIYGTRRGIPFGHFFGPTTLSKDKKTLYCFVWGTPNDGIFVKGITNKVTNVKVIGSNKNLTFKRNGGASWAGVPGVILINLPKEELDTKITVVAIELDSPLKLYRGNGANIEEN